MASEELALETEDRNGIRILRLIGRCTVYSSQMVKDTVRAALDEGKDRIIFDLSRCELMDSAGLGSLVSCRFNCVKKGGSLHLCNVSMSVLGSLKLARLDRLLSICGNLDSAIEAAGGAEPAP